MKSWGSKHMLLLVVVVAAASWLSAVEGQVPVPRRELGYVYGNGMANASVHLDFFIDLICPDSQAALPTMVKLATLYGGQTLQLTTHLFPLPYHRAGFYAAKGVHVVNYLSKHTKVYDWFNKVYSDMDNLVNKVTHDISDAAIVERLAKLAEEVSPGAGVPFPDLVDSEPIEEDTRIAWKYACTRGVAATPTFFVNDIVVAADPTWTVEDWKKVIDPLLKPREQPLLFQKVSEGKHRWGDRL